jgi:hypothetical protein
MRVCEHFKNWSEEFVTLECWFYGAKTGYCHYDVREFYVCQWQGKPPLLNSSCNLKACLDPDWSIHNKPLGDS